MTPIRNDRRYHSQKANLGTRNRLTSRVTIYNYKCREYDHFAHECPNTVTDDSDDYESDRATLQLITAEAELHDNFDSTRLNEEQDYLNL